MTDAAIKLIQSFRTLSPEERYAVLIELAQISETDFGPLSDDDLMQAGEEVFAMYDAEEAENGETEKR